MDSEMIEPCPRCRSAAFVTVTNEVWCLMDGCLRLSARASREEAIAAWNTRTPDPAIVKLREALVGLRAQAEFWGDIDAETAAAIAAADAVLAEVEPKP